MKCFESFWMSIVHTGSIENQRKTYLAEGLNDFFRYRIAYIYVCAEGAFSLVDSLTGNAVSGERVSLSLSRRREKVADFVRTTPGLEETTQGFEKTNPGLVKTTPGLVSPICPISMVIQRHGHENHTLSKLKIFPLKQIDSTLLPFLLLFIGTFSARFPSVPSAAAQVLSP